MFIKKYMKRRILILVLLVFGITIFSCTKEKETIIKKVVTNNDLTNIGDTIFLGWKKNMIITPINFDLYPPSPFNSYKTYQIDINMDGINDFSFYIEMLQSQAYGVRTNTSINCLNSNSSIASFNKTDTLFYNLDTINFQINKNYSCEKINNLDSIVNIIPNQSKIISFEPIEKLFNSTNFNSDSIPLFKASYSSPNTYIPPYNYRSFYINDCDLLPLNTILYIGVKIDDGFGNIKLGWIKINHKYEHWINIIEYAIQI